jgi:hypothetical protein
VPVKGSDGTVTYVLSLIPHLEAFAEVIRRQHPPATWVVSVIDPRGVNIARVSDGERFVAHEAPPGLLAPLQAEQEGVELIRDRAGNPLFLAGTIHDVTELRAAQRHEKELERLLMQSEARGARHLGWPRGARPQQHLGADPGTVEAGPR